jgi:NADH-ubiquinone oxidoreductase chain 6
MLINIRNSELISDTNNNIPLATLAIIGISIPYNDLVPNTKSNLFSGFDNINKYVYYVTSNNWDSNTTDISDIISVGNVIYTNYSIWLIIISIILLLAMVGSIVITIKQSL